RHAHLEVLVRGEGRPLGAREVPGEGDRRSDGARRVHPAEVRGQPEPVPRRELEAGAGRDREGGFRRVRRGVQEGRGGGERVPRAARQAVHQVEAAGGAPARPGPDAAAEEVARRGETRPVRDAVRLPVSLALSALVHAAVLALLLRALPPARPIAVAFPVSLVGAPGGGGGGDDASRPPGPPPGPPPGAPAAAPAPPPDTARAAPPRPAPPAARSAATRPAHRQRVARTAPPAPPPAPAPNAAAPGAADARAASGPAGAGGGARGGGSADGAGGGGGSGGGDGSGGDGSGGARVAYGTNPRPDYPLVARRLGMEGVVVLAVVVAPDGRAAEVRVARSSGFAPLDDSAVRTVRERWRFVPARRDGVPV